MDTIFLIYWDFVDDKTKNTIIRHLKAIYSNQKRFSNRPKIALWDGRNSAIIEAIKDIGLEPIVYKIEPEKVSSCFIYVHNDYNELQARVDLADYSLCDLNIYLVDQLPKQKDLTINQEPGYPDTTPVTRPAHNNKDPERLPLNRWRGIWRGPRIFRTFGGY